MKANVCVSCRGRILAPPPFQDGEQLKDSLWVEPSYTEPDIPHVKRGWICTQCYIVHWAQEASS